MTETKRPTMRAVQVRSDASATIRLDHAERVTTPHESFVPTVLHARVEHDHTGHDFAQLIVATTGDGGVPLSAQWSNAPGGRRLTDAPLDLRAAAVAHLPAIEPYLRGAS